MRRSPLELTRPGWLTFDTLRYLRALRTTDVYGEYSRLSLAQVGQQWGEGEWTARDLHRATAPGVARA